MRYLLITMIIFSGCGANNRSSVTVDPALQPYFTSFESDVGVSTFGISANFSNTETQTNPLGETIGECVMYSDGTKIIQIDASFWATLDQNGKTELMYHELGHCAMNMVHINTIQAGGCPVSIMNQYFFGESDCYSGSVEYYYQELSSHT